jgi:hypothetical protein
VLNLAGTFVFGLSGGLKGVSARLDIFGIMVLAVVVGIAPAASPATCSSASRPRPSATGGTSPSASPPA